MADGVARWATMAASALTLPLLAGGLCGCSSSDEPAARVTTPTTTAASSSSPGTTAGSAAADSQVARKGEPISAYHFTRLVRRGLEHSTTARLALSVDSPSMRLSATGHVDYTEDRTAVALSGRMPSAGLVDVRIVDGMVYVGMPSGDAATTFYRMRVSDLGRALGGSLDGLQALDPTTTLAALGTRLDQVSDLGPETMDGERLHHYVLSADTATVDVWLDDRHRLCRATAGVADSTVSVTMEDWGRPVRIETPPAAQVRPMPRD